MKKCLKTAIILAMTAFIQFAAFAQPSDDRYWTEDSLANLNYLGVIDGETAKDFRSGEFITRRDMYEAVYSVVKIANGGLEDFFDYARDMTDEEFAEVMKRYIEKDVIPIDGLFPEWNGEFADCEYKSYDYCLAYTLLYEDLMFGNPIEGSNLRTANFDFKVTYAEAIATLSRFLLKETDYRMPGWDEIGNYPYYGFTCNIGLINSGSAIDQGGLYVSEDMLCDVIPPMEFAYLLNRALYIPTVSVGDPGGARFDYRYIDRLYRLRGVLKIGENFEIVKVSAD